MALFVVAYEEDDKQENGDNKKRCSVVCFKFQWLCLNGMMTHTPYMCNVIQSSPPPHNTLCFEVVEG